MLLRHAPGIVLSSSSSCVVAWQKRRRMLELTGDGPTPEQRSRCPRLSSPSLKTPTAPRKEYEVSKRIKEPTRAPLQSIDSRAVQVRLNSSLPVSVAQAKQGVQEQNVARQSGSVGGGLEAPWKASSKQAQTRSRLVGSTQMQTARIQRLRLMLVGLTTLTPRLIDFCYCTFMLAILKSARS